ncbi:MAG: alpha/beta fold hydrolase, partial [Caulobacteraceae bacterium]|nr:alpha/beta fold hydrolase [Caulobacteraceae bacterium]
MIEALVLLSGLASDEAVWAEAAAGLGGAARPIPLVARGGSIAEMAADVLARAPERFALVGHSMGGYVALAVLAAAPERVTRLALINSSAAPDRLGQAQRRTELIARVETDGYDTVIADLAPLLVHERNRANSALVEAVAAMTARAGQDRFIREQRAVMGRPDQRGWLTSVRLPLLAIGAADDRIVPPADSAEIARLAPGAR